MNSVRALPRLPSAALAGLGALALAACAPPAEETSAQTASQATAATSPQRNPGDTFADCPTCPSMVVIPPGRLPWAVGVAKSSGMKAQCAM